MKREPHTHATLARHAVSLLQERKTENPETDVRILLEAASGLSHAGLISSAREAVSREVEERFNAFLERRLLGEPVHRILGYREFYGREFHLSADTLVPRDDTGVLVDQVLGQYKNQPTDLRFMDIGTGSGIIAVTLACEMPNVTLLASDVSDDALVTAQKNAKRHDVNTRIEFKRHDLFEGVVGKYNAIISNPPYIPVGDIETLDIEVRCHDPLAALAGGNDGLLFYRSIFQNARHYLLQDGMVFVEIGIGQSDDVVSLAQANGFTDISTVKDYSGIDRVVCAKL